MNTKCQREVGWDGGGGKGRKGGKGDATRFPAWLRRPSPLSVTDSARVSQQKEKRVRRQYISRITRRKTNEKETKQSKVEKAEREQESGSLGIEQIEKKRGESKQKLSYAKAA